MIKILHKKQLSLLLLAVLLITLNLSGFLTIVKAGPHVPEDHANNDWHWGIDVGDELYWEVDVVLTNASSGEINLMFKDIWIYNITSIENVTLDWFGMGLNEFSLVNATQCYHNVTEGVIEPYGPPSEFALFGYNASDSIPYKMRAGMGAAPYILPLNGSSLDVDVLDDILNESFYDPLSKHGYNQFDSYSSNIGDNSITFMNSTDGYYMYMEYNPTDGVAEYAEAYMRIFMGEPMLVNVTMQRVMDYDITDEIEWGVDIGDTFFYDWTEGSSSYYDVKLEIVDITESNLPKSNNAFDLSREINMVFQTVLANLSLWNGYYYQIEEISLPIGIANNFYFQYFDEDFSPQFNFVIPNNTLKEDIEYMWNLDSLRIWDAPFDEIVIVENGNFDFSLKNSSDNFKVETSIDRLTGITQSFMIQEHSYVQLYYEIKDMTLVEWNVDIGDVVYYKQNSQDGEIYRRATIVFTDGEFVNMTEWELDSGGLFTKIPGQPELQFFKAVIAEFEEFDESTGTWQPMGDDLFLEANKYWPISPYAMFGGVSPPLFLTSGSTGEDLENLLTILDSVFDESTFTEDHVILRNSTLGREYDMYVDISTGAITFMGGWMNMLGGDDTTWMYMTIYPMYNETLNSGTTSVSVPNDAISEITVSNIEVITDNDGIELLNAILDYNPINTSINNGTVLYYNDFLITNTTGLDNLTFYIKFADTFDLDNYNLTFWAWNMSGNNEWEAAPSSATNMFIYDYSDNSLTIIFPVGGGSGPISIIMAVSYVYTGPSEESIPGFSVLLTFGSLSIGIIALIILYYKKTRMLQI
ncbi:MAG: hypothetical protein HWN79_16525 [Candidatus Lokiarchaeota archaeon]|nr:hypothetical protein [Candidatus Lokiarchaeota archaeon]